MRAIIFFSLLCSGLAVAGEGGVGGDRPAEPERAEDRPPVPSLIPISTEQVLAPERHFPTTVDAPTPIELVDFYAPPRAEGT